jgi:uncharacterized cupredoxin-like copper-binding protein
MKKVLIAGAMMVAISACTRGETKEQNTDDAAKTVVVVNDVTVRTRDFVFLDLPDTIPSGATNIRLLNEGPDLHHVWLVRLEEGKTVADLMKAMGTTHGALPAWAVDVGGPNTPVPGESTAATLDLEAGRYALICVIPAKDGVPHVMKGMVRELTVVPNKTPAPLPKADIVLTLKDYSFEFDKPVKRGVQTIRVENAAQQSHEVVLLQLQPGKKVQDMLAWFSNGQAGPPPGKPIGGTTGFAQGEVNMITHDFAPGNYGMICFVPDAKDGKAHVAHGMVSEFTVTE